MQKYPENKINVQENKKTQDQLLERTVDWRKLFSSKNLKQGEAIAEAGQYEDLTISGNNAYAKIGEYRKAFRVQIYGAPAVSWQISTATAR